MSAGADVERKLVSVLFLDLVGSTAHFERQDPEDIHEVLAAYQSAVKSAIEDHGGSVEKFIGDAVVAVFGAPLAHGDDAERAVRAALAALEAVDRLGLELEVRAAVCTGEAVVEAGAAKAVEAIATGDVMSTAARLQTAAPVGGLLVGSVTHAATRGIRYGERIEVDAKGKALPVPAWPVLGTDSDSTPRSRLVGRDSELATLREAWRGAGAGQLRLLTVVGPPGIGKSALVHAFLRETDPERRHTLRGRCLPYGQRRTYSAFAEQLMSAAGIYENDAPDALIARLRSFSDQYLAASEADELQRYLSLMLGLPSPDPISNRVLLFFAARRLLEGMARAQPTIVLFEDLHWATEAERALVGYLAEHLQGRLLVLVTTRPELPDRHGQAIDLTPLADGAAELLLAGVVPADRVAGVVALAGGNPLFLEELAATVGEGGLTLPATVHEAIAARLDSLPAQVRAVLLDASVFGRVFWQGPLAELAGPLDGTLEELQARDLVRQEPASHIRGETQFAFKHILVREVAYNTLSRRTRRARHAAAAAALEARFQAGGGELRRQAGYHWRAAGIAERAIEHLLVAAESALAGWDKEEAIAIYADVLELIPNSDARARARVRALRGRALADLTDYAAAADELAAVMPDLEGEEELEALLALARALFWLEDTEKLEAASDRLLARARADGRSEFLAPALSIAGIVLAARGGEGALERSLEMGQAAFEIWPAGKRQAELAIHEHHHGLEYYWSGDYAKAAEFGRAAFVRGSEHFSLEATYRGGVEAALGLVGQGRHEEAIALVQGLIQQAQLIGRGRYGIMIRLVWATALVDLCQFETALELNAEAVEIAREIEVDFQQLMAGIDRLLAQLAMGEYGRAQSEVQPTRERLEAARASGWHLWLAEGRFSAGLAALTLATKGGAEAAEAAAKAAEFNGRMGRPKYEIEGRLALASALAALKRPADALSEATRARELADRLGTPPARWRTRALLGHLLIRSDEGAAEAAYREAAGILRGFTATLRPEHAASLERSPLAQEILRAAP